MIGLMCDKVAPSAKLNPARVHQAEINPRRFSVVLIFSRVLLFLASCDLVKTPDIAPLEYAVNLRPTQGALLVHLFCRKTAPLALELTTPYLVSQYSSRTGCCATNYSSILSPWAAYSHVLTIHRGICPLLITWR